MSSEKQNKKTCVIVVIRLAKVTVEGVALYLADCHSFHPSMHVHSKLFQLQQNVFLSFENDGR